MAPVLQSNTRSKAQLCQREIGPNSRDITHRLLLGLGFIILSRFSQWSSNRKSAHCENDIKYYLWYWDGKCNVWHRKEVTIFLSMWATDVTFYLTSAKYVEGKISQLCASWFDKLQNRTLKSSIHSHLKAIEMFTYLSLNKAFWPTNQRRLNVKGKVQAA